MHESLKTHPNIFDMYEWHIKAKHSDDYIFSGQITFHNYVMKCSSCGFELDLDPEDEQKKQDALIKKATKSMGEEFTRRRDKQILELFNAVH